MPRPKKNNTTLTDTDIVQAAVNAPALATRTFTLGDKEYPVLDLPYDDYIQFLALLQPFLDALTGQVAKVAGLGESQSTSASNLLRYCAANLPDMVQITARQSVPSITI